MTMIDANALPIDDDEGMSGDASDGEPIAFLFWLSRLAEGRSFSRTDAHLQFNPPRAFGRFLLESLLGAGTYGAVFLATDTELERKVALKVAWPAVLLDAETSRRFIEEPKTVAAISHPGIVEVYDSGGVDMAHYISFELISGPTLASWIASQNQISIVVAARLIQQVATAVHFANERGIIHRDLKPSNILLRPFDRQDDFPFQPVVTDFGLARRRRPVEVSDMTATRAVVGTDRYMSPEQASGQNSDVGPASDVFSLGVILYELVTGTRPFDGETPDQIREQIRLADPPAIRPWRRNVPRDIETIIFKCLEKSSQARYRSSGELARDLQRFLHHEPIVARPTPVWQRAVKFCRRHPWAVSLMPLCVTGLLLVAGLTGALIAERRSAARQIASALESTAQAEAQDRQQQYVTTIRRAAESFTRGHRQEVLECLERAKTLARPPVGLDVAWKLLWAQTHDAERTIRAHTGKVNSLCFSTSDGTLISGGDDGRVVFWNPMTGRSLRSLNENKPAVTSLAVSPDGKQLMVAHSTGQAVVYRLADGTVQLDRKAFEGRLWSVAWLGDSKRCAVAGDDAAITIFELEQNTCRRIPIEYELENGVRGTAATIHSLAFLPERHALAVSTGTRGVVIIDVDTFDRQTTWCAENTVVGIFHAGVNPERLACYDNDRSIRFLTSIDGQVQATLQTPFTATSLRFVQANNMLIAGAETGLIQVWDVPHTFESSHQSYYQSLCQRSAIRTIDISADGDVVASGSDDGTIVINRSARLKERFDVDLDRWAYVADFSPCGRWFAVVQGALGIPGRLTLFDATTHQELWKINESINEPAVAEACRYLPHTRVAFSPDGSELAFPGEDLKLRTYDTATGRIVREFEFPTGPPPEQIWYSPDGRRLVVNQGRTGMVMLDRESGQVIASHQGYERRCIGAFHTCRGDMLIEPASATTVRLRDAITGHEELVLEGIPDSILITAVSPDGRWLAGSGYNHIIYLWDLQRPGPPDKLVGHTIPVASLTFSSDNRTLISHDNAYTACLWDVATRTELLKLGTNQEQVTSISLHPDDKVLLLGIKQDDKFGLRSFPLNTAGSTTGAGRSY